MTEGDSKRAAELKSDIRKALTALPSAYALLPLFTEPGSAPADPDRRTGSNSIAWRSITNFGVMDLLDTREKRDADGYTYRLGIVPRLSWWCRRTAEEMLNVDRKHPEYGLAACSAVCEEAPIRARTNQMFGPCSEKARHHATPITIGSECGFLLEHLDWIAAQDWAPHLCRTLDRMLRSVQRATGTLEEKHEVTLICINENCGWAVEERYNGTVYHCTGCESSWGRMELHRLAERKQPKTLKECLRYVSVGERTLREYKAQGLIQPVGRKGSADLFDLAKVQEVVVIEEQARMRQNRSKSGRFVA